MRSVDNGVVAKELRENHGYCVEYAYFALERTEINGSRTCTISVTGSRGTSSALCDDVADALEESTEMSDSDAGIVKDIVDAIKEIAELPEKLEKCAKVVNPNDASATLLTDRAKGYEVAERAFMNVYKDSLPAIHNLTPVDIQYANGTTYTFQVQWLRFNPPSVELFNPVMVKSTETTCK